MGRREFISINTFLLINGIQQWKKKFERQTVVENFNSLHRLLIEKEFNKTS